MGSDDLSTQVAGYADTLHTGPSDEQLEATTCIRKLLGKEQSPPIDVIVDSEPPIVPKLVEFLGNDDCPDLQFEAAWSLSNIASGTSAHTRAVIDSNAIPELVRLLSSPKADVQEQVVWALGNIAGDSPAQRDLVINHGGIEALVDSMDQRTDVSFLRNAMWCLSNFYRGKPRPHSATIAAALPMVVRMMQHSDNDVKMDALWAISYASDGSSSCIQSVVDQPGVVQRLIQECTANTSRAIVTPALRTIGNIVTGSDQQTQLLLDAGALSAIRTLMTNSTASLCLKECCWALSNITAGSRSQIQAVIDEGLLAPVINALATGSNDVKKEATWVLSNLAEGGSKAHIAAAVEAGCIPPMVACLRHEPRIRTIALAGLDNIAKAAPATPPPDAQHDAHQGERQRLYAELTEVRGILSTMRSRTSGRISNELRASLEKHSFPEAKKQAVPAIQRRIAELTESLAALPQQAQPWREIMLCSGLGDMLESSEDDVSDSLISFLEGKDS
eukprot:TRINITY_DN3075_c0_g1_i10.p1 TRINITY_DN3075_c0_g1~~TRINITY_DN3075_c0_g1_i10.p1  ORF type:complete len:503 (+),score=91.17 TRINITY_DN3075_c0_g1_i10:68-1576(+)